MRRAACGGAIGLLLLSTLIPGCSKNAVTGRRQVILINKQDEIAIGDEVAGQFEQQFGGTLDDPILQQYVSEVGGRVAAKAPRDMPYRFAILASDIPNAFALPGGRIYVTAGLMRLMSEERELAAVLGHEVVHVAAQHTVKELQNQMLGAVLVQLAGAAAGPNQQQAAELAAKVVTGMVNLRYSREYEYQADQYGTIYMAEAGYNPWGMVELLQALQAASQQPGNSLTEMFQTHPLTGKRIAAAEEVVRTRFPQWARTPDPDAAQYLEMRKRLPAPAQQP